MEREVVGAERRPSSAVADPTTTAGKRSLVDQTEADEGCEGGRGAASSETEDAGPSQRDRFDEAVADPPPGKLSLGGSRRGGDAPKQGGEGGPSGGRGHRRARAGGRPAQGIQVRVHQRAVEDAAPDRRRVGVGEAVTFTAARPGTWRATSALEATSATGTTFEWRSTDVPSTVSILHQPDGGGPEQRVDMTVVAPERVEFVKKFDRPREPAGAGMKCNLHFHPKTVSFDALEWLEDPDNAPEVTGYFREHRNADPRRTFVHRPAVEWVPMGPDNHGVDDEAWTENHPRLGTPPRWFEGTYAWRVPNRYRIAGRGAGHVFETLFQRFRMDDAGNVTVTKKEASVTQAPSGLIAGDSPLESLDSEQAATRYILSEGLLKALRYVTTFRVRQPDSYRHLVAALRTMGNANRVYWSMRCTNSYSIIGDDAVTLQIAGTQPGPVQTFDLDTDRFRQGEIPFLQLFDLAQFTSQSSLTFSANVRGHANHSLTMAMGFPFDTMGDYRDMPGSEGRYRMRAWIKDAREPSTR